MSTRISKEDIWDLDVVDAEELVSDGHSSYKTSIGIVSVVGATKTVTVSGGISYGDDPVEAGDGLTISGNDAAGDYTVASILSDTQFTVVEAIVDATGGSVAFRHPPGARRVGVRADTFRESTATNLQSLSEDLELVIRGRDTDADGPVTHLLTGAYRETLPAADPFPTLITWWESPSKLKKIVDKTITRSGGGATPVAPTPVVWRIYGPDGATVRLTISDAITYSGVFELSRTRTIS